MERKHASLSQFLLPPSVISCLFPLGCSQSSQQFPCHLCLLLLSVSAVSICSYCLSPFPLPFFIIADQSEPSSSGKIRTYFIEEKITNDYRTDSRRAYLSSFSRSSPIPPSLCLVFSPSVSPSFPKHYGAWGHLLSFSFFSSSFSE